MRKPIRSVPPAALAVALLGLAAAAGCGTSNPHPAGTYGRAAFWLERGDRDRAIVALEDFLRRSPTDSLAAQAQYQKATAYLEMEEFPLAAVEYQIFRKDYPMSDLVDDAYYLEGVAMFEEVGRIERDISGALEAREHFRRFLRLYPESPRAADARGRLREISDLVVRKKLEAAEVYRHLGRHASIVVLMEGLLKEETDSGLLDQVLLTLGDAARRAGDPDRAAQAYRQLLERYPASGRAADARRALADLGDAPVAAERAASPDTAGTGGAGAQRPPGQPRT